jgi:hypothetical protein
LRKFIKQIFFIGVVHNLIISLLNGGFYQWMGMRKVQ